MILTGSEIKKEVKNNRIHIEPFNEDFLNPNSYNYHLGKKLKVAPESIIDPKEHQLWDEFEIPDSGFLLRPAKIYLGYTIETIGSCDYVTSLIGRSSMGRLGLYLQVSADLAQLGAIHRWTLELCAVQPFMVYKGMEIGQVSFWKPVGEKQLYTGIYGNISYPFESQPID